MATTVEEPNQLAPGELTDETIGRFAVIVYEQSPTDAGLKQLKMANLKSFLDYNSQKADNIATLVGFHKDSGVENDKYDFNGQVIIPENESTVLDKIQAIASNAGVPLEETVGTPTLNDKIETLNDYVKDGWAEGDEHFDGLLSRTQNIETDVDSIHNEIGEDSTAGTIKGRIKANEDNISGITNKIGNESTVEETLTASIAKNTTDIESLKEEVGGGGGGGSSTLTGRIENLETTVGTDTEHGLQKKFGDLETTVGDSESGLIKKTDDLESNLTTVDGRTTTLEGYVKDGWEDESDPSNPKHVDSLLDRTTALETDVQGIHDDIGTNEDYDYSGTKPSTVKQHIGKNTRDISDIMQSLVSVYKFQGDATSSYMTTVSVVLTENPGSDRYQNGFVWNAKGAGSANRVEFKYPNTEDGTLYKFADGENFALVKNERIEGDEKVWDITFDKLGVSIDVVEINQKIDALDTRVDTLNTTVGDNNSGLVKDVSSLKTTVGDNNSGLVKLTNDLNTSVDSLTTVVGATATDGLQKEVADLKSVVGTSTSGLVSNVDYLMTTVGNDDNTGLRKDVKDLQAMNKIETSSSEALWSSANLKSGTYLITFRTGTNKTGSFIGTFDNSGCLVSNDAYIDLANNFATIFSTDVNNIVSTSLYGNLSILKLI